MVQRVILLMVLLFGIQQLTDAQFKLTTKSSRAVKFYKEGLSDYNLLYYDQAIEALNHAIEVDTGFVEAYLLLGEVYSDDKKDSDAIICFRKGIQVNPEFFPPVYSNLANLEFNNGLYTDALIHIKKFLSYPNIPEKYQLSGETLLQSCEFAKNAIRHPVPFHPVNLGPAINSPDDEYWPSLSADEQTMVFTRLLPINPDNPNPLRNRQEDFYISKFENGKWTAAKPMGPPVNTPGNEGAQTITADGRFLVFTGCNRRDGYGSCDLYFSEKDGDKWSIPQNMGPPINTAAKETQPSLSADGKTLYFSSNRPHGKGGFDIWESRRLANGNWSNPINLGDSINSPYDEESPFIHPDDQTLYFSSNGWPGLGRFDLFVSHRKADTLWTTPKNLGYPINTYHSEEGMIVNARGNMAYYSSDRSGEGGRDLFRFELYKKVRPVPVSYMKGKVYNADTYDPLDAHFVLIDLHSDSVIMDARSDQTNGTFLICIPSGRDYALNVNKKGYLFYSDHFTMKNGNYDKPFIKDIPMKPIKVGEKVVMRNVFFDHDSYVLKPESKAELNQVVEFLKNNPTLRVEISGHTDDIGTSAYNLILSEKRARSVVDFFTDKGISRNRFTAKGYGNTQPIADNKTKEGRALNRRTEFKVIAP